MAAAAIIFFAFYGFDAIATAAEETTQSQARPGDRHRRIDAGLRGDLHDHRRGAALGATPFSRFANSPEPLALILRELGQPGAAHFLARLGGDRPADGDPRLLLRPEPHLLRHGARRAAAPPAWRGCRARRAGADHAVHRVDRRRRSPRFFPLDEIVALANAGTLVAFSAVAVCMLIMRRRAPDGTARLPHARGLAGRSGRDRGLRSICSSACRSRPSFWFLIWNLAGIVLYIVYGKSGRERPRHASKAHDDVGIAGIRGHRPLTVIANVANHRSITATRRLSSPG